MNFLIQSREKSIRHNIENTRNEMQGLEMKNFNIDIFQFTLLLPRKIFSLEPQQSYVRVSWLHFSLCFELRIYFAINNLDPCNNKDY